MQLDMDGVIGKKLRLLKGQYAAFWLLAGGFFLAGELTEGFTGIWAEDVKRTYIAETLGILLAVAMVPLALKMFAVVLKKRIDEVNLEEAMVAYVRWNGVRMLLLTVPMVINIAVYYLTLSNTGLLCALIVMVAALFCVPTQARLKADLHIGE